MKAVIEKERLNPIVLNSTKTEKYADKTRDWWTMTLLNIESLCRERNGVSILSMRS